jgi:dihydrofolate reductase
MRRFKALTIGHAVIMGRRTFETLERPLPQRLNIVLTRDQTYRRPGIEIVHSLDEALGRAEGDREVFVVGGEEIYRAALDRAHRIYLTVVHAVVDGDTFFPEFDTEEWHLEEDAWHSADKRHGFAYSFRLYLRRARLE